MNEDRLSTLSDYSDQSLEAGLNQMYKDDFELGVKKFKAKSLKSKKLQDAFE